MTPDPALLAAVLADPLDATLAVAVQDHLAEVGQDAAVAALTVDYPAAVARAGTADPEDGRGRGVAHPQ